MIPRVPPTRRTALLGLGASLAGLAACSPGPGSSTPPAGGTAAGTPTAAGRTVRSVAGPVRVPAEVTSVVVTEGRRDLDVALALGLPLVGFPRDADAGDALPRFEEELRAAERAGARELFSRNEINLEAVAAARPDLVLGRDEDLADLPELAAVAPVLPLGSTSSAVPWQDDLRVVAEATGRGDVAERLLADYAADLDALRAAHPEALRRPVLVAALADAGGGVSVDAGRLVVGVLRDLGAALAPALSAVLPDGDQDFSAETVDRATAGADLLVLVVGAQERAALDTPAWRAVPALAQGRTAFVDKFVNEGGPLTARSVVGTLRDLYASA